MISDELKQREKLSDLCHMLHLFGWTDLILNHVSSRLISNTEYYLFNPFGLLYQEVSPNSIVKINKNGSLVGDGYHCNPAGYILHSAIYEARNDINCIIHTHTPYGIAIANLENGLLLADQMSMMFHQRIGYHDLQNIVVDSEERLSLAKNIGCNTCMILRNHGLVATGSSIEEAFFNYYYLELACKTQILTLSTSELIRKVPQEVVSKVFSSHSHFNKFSNTVRPGYPGNAELAFNALKRVLNKNENKIALRRTKIHDVTS